MSQKVFSKNISMRTIFCSVLGYIFCRTQVFDQIGFNPICFHYIGAGICLKFFGTFLFQSEHTAGKNWNPLKTIIFKTFFPLTLQFIFYPKTNVETFSLRLSSQWYLKNELSNKLSIQIMKIQIPMSRFLQRSSSFLFQLLVCNSAISDS